MITLLGTPTNATADSTFIDASCSVTTYLVEIVIRIFAFQLKLLLPIRIKPRTKAVATPIELDRAAQA